MHRSGTSAMARVLGLAGANLPERVITAGADNPLGFWEPRDVVLLNDEILRVVGSEWDDLFGVRVEALVSAQQDVFLPRAREVLDLNYGSAGTLVLKDPRVSLLSPLWRAALEQAGCTVTFVIMVRDPLEVAQSIAARDGSPVSASMMVWLSHMLAIERDTRSVSRVFVRYTDLLEDWRSVVACLGPALPAPSEIASVEISNYLSASARHHAVDAEVWAGRSDVLPGIIDAWRWFEKAATGKEPDPSALDRILAQVMALNACVGPALQRRRDDASRQRAGLLSLLGDQERANLRLRAQVGEYKSARGSLAERADELDGRLSGTLDQLAATRIRLHAAEAIAAAERAGAEQARHVQEQATTAAERDARAVVSELQKERGQAVGLAAELQKERGQAVGLAAELQQERERAAGLADELNSATRDLCATQDRARSAEAMAERLQSKLDVMTSSTSWALTRPVRVVQKRLRRSGKPDGHS